jgi:hypothetical protein
MKPLQVLVLVVAGLSGAALALASAPASGLCLLACTTTGSSSTSNSVNPLQVTLAAEPMLLGLYQFPDATAQVAPGGAGLDGDLQESFPPYQTWTTVASATVSADGSLSWPSSTWNTSYPDRNAQFRAQLPGATVPSSGPPVSYSNVAQVIVEPHESLEVEVDLSPTPVAIRRPGHSPTLRHPPTGVVTFLLFGSARRTSGPYSGPVAYAYARPSARGPYRPLFARRFHLVTSAYGSNPEVTTNLHDRRVDWSHAQFLLCTRSPVLTDVGPAFSYPACGRSITAPAPAFAGFAFCFSHRITNANPVFAFRECRH